VPRTSDRKLKRNLALRAEEREGPGESGRARVAEITTEENKHN
jgi:hypothetical protein